MNDEIMSRYMECIKRKYEIEKSLKLLTKGYISKKNIGNKEYTYLQHREAGKIVSTYIKKCDERILREQLELRKMYEEELTLLEVKINELRKAAKKIDKAFYRDLLVMEFSYGMDDISVERKEKCMAFSAVVNAVEGTDVSQDMLNDLEAWRLGEFKFIDVFDNVFRR